MNEEMDAVIRSIWSLSRKHGLSPTHRAMLGHDGSMTRLLELITCQEVTLQTIGQRIIPCPNKAAQLLKATPREPVNERDILMIGSSDGRPILHARSYAPLSRLRPDFKEDLLRADIPIGKIMEKYKIEVRREILKVGYISNHRRLASLLKHPGPYLGRTYNIIMKERPLITIAESFPAPIFTDFWSGSS